MGWRCRFWFMTTALFGSWWCYTGDEHYCFLSMSASKTPRKERGLLEFESRIRLFSCASKEASLDF
ncbi:hypothetical protein NC653_006780 [Populus alba x Populus x berolinensis]|uniref:Secreted protein n=1 Tax=Populus alba x Populus x berolinensis TaxID=444605 RepID=A0AAD6WDH4_9ROSI|nr:hypothetical protein NC653_006780 [Populus alba x Populus x berolinensis]